MARAIAISYIPYKDVKYMKDFAGTAANKNERKINTFNTRLVRIGVQTDNFSCGPFVMYALLRMAQKRNFPSMILVKGKQILSIRKQLRQHIVEGKSTLTFEEGAENKPEI